LSIVEEAHSFKFYKSIYIQINCVAQVVSASALIWSIEYIDA